MNKYKPEYMGKVIPVNDTLKLSDFVTNKYDAFSKIYDTCKDQSDGISDLKVVEANDGSPDTLSVRVTADSRTLNKIKEVASGNESVSVDADVITAKG